MKYLWREDGEPTGHFRYCVHPGSHRAGMTWCRADESEPATMRGGASKAFREDHPTEETGDADT
jgi:hypothetical protein